MNAGDQHGQPDQELLTKIIRTAKASDKITQTFVSNICSIWQKYPASIKIEDFNFALTVNNNLFLTLLIEGIHLELLTKNQADGITISDNVRLLLYFLLL